MLALLTREYFEKLVFIYYLVETNTLSDSFIAKLIQYNKDVYRLIVKHSLFKYKEAEETWSISNIDKKTEDYLFFSFLKKLPEESLFEILNEEDKMLPPSWYNSLLMLTDDENINTNVKEKIKNKFPSIFIKSYATYNENEFINEAIKKEIFQKIFEEYENLNIWIDEQKYPLRDLVKFGDSTTNFDYLITKIKTTDNIRTKNKAINLLSIFIPSKERSIIILKTLEKELSTQQEEYGIVWVSYYCLSNYNEYYTKEQRIKLINLSTTNIKSIKNHSYIRASVYYYINKCDLHDNYIDYMLEGLTLLKLSHDVNAKENQSRLLDESINLELLFFKISNKKNLLTIIKILLINYKDYNTYDVEKTVNELLTKATKILNNEKNIKQFKSRLISIFSNYNSKLDNWFYWTEMFSISQLEAFIINTLKAEQEILHKLIYDSNIFKERFSISIEGIEKLITKNSYKEIFNGVDNELIEIEQAKEIYHFLDKRKTEILILYKQELLKRNIDISQEINTPNTHEIEQFKIEQFNLLFNVSKFKQEVLHFFKDRNNIKFSWKEVPEWYKDKFYFNDDLRLNFLRNLDYGNLQTVIEKTQIIKHFEKINLKNVLNKLIFQQLHRKKYKLNDTQKEYLIEWLKEESEKVNFKNALKTDGTSLKLNSRLLDLIKYKNYLGISFSKTTSLDLLSFDDLQNINLPYEDRYDTYFMKLINDINNLELVKKRVFNNLQEQISHPPILTNHIIFSVENNLIENYPLIKQNLISILSRLQDVYYNGNPYLVYFLMTKDFDFFKKYFPKELTELFWNSIQLLIQYDSYNSFVEERLNEQFNLSENYNDKVRISNLLIENNSQNALTKLSSTIRKAMVESIPLNSYVKESALLKYTHIEIKAAIDIIKLRYEFNLIGIDNPTRAIILYFKELILNNKETFTEIVQKLEELLKKEKSTITNIEFLKIEIDQLKNFFYKNYKSNYSIKDALNYIEKTGS